MLSGTPSANYRSNSANYQSRSQFLQRIDGHAWPMPHNPAYQAIPADNATILGKVVTVVRPEL